MTDPPQRRDRCAEGVIGVCSTTLRKSIPSLLGICAQKLATSATVIVAAGRAGVLLCASSRVGRALVIELLGMNGCGWRND